MQPSSSVLNPHAVWLNTRGMWLGYTVSVVFLHFLLNCIPVLSVPIVWTLTHGIHNIGMFIMFHYLKGAPFETMDQNNNRFFTAWEQIDNGEQFTATRNFLTTVPIALFILAGFFTIHDVTLTTINIVLLLIGVVPKLPFFNTSRTQKME